MINFLQRSEKKAPVPVDDEFLMPEDPFLPETFETMLALSDELRRLPAKEGEILQAILMDGREAKEVARERGIDISHVYRLKRNALAKLRKWLDAEATNEV